MLDATRHLLNEKVEPLFIFCTFLFWLSSPDLKPTLHIFFKNFFIFQKQVSEQVSNLVVKK